MAMTPSIGDILMLSQTAWKIGRAFTQGKKSAPSEFAEVESEAQGLSEALKLVAETLHADGSILLQADDSTQEAIATILEAAQKTLADLESFVERYTVIKRRPTNGGLGFSVDRQFSEAVMANYKTLKWTTEGGNITALRDMLNMHTNTISLTMQALQSRSLARLEKTVMPMAENVASVHDRVNGDLADKIDDLHRIIMAVANSTPSLQARDAHGRLDSAASDSTVSTTEAREGSSVTSRPRMLEAPPPRTSSHSFPIRQPDRRESHDSLLSERSVVHVRSGREDSGYYSVGLLPLEKATKQKDWGFESGNPPSARSSIAGGYNADPSTTMLGSPTSFSQPGEGSSSRRASNIARRESTTLPNLFLGYSDDDTREGSHSRTAEQQIEESPVSPLSKHSMRFGSIRRQPLPPPALPPSSTSPELEPATPNTILASSEHRRSSAASAKRPPTATSVQNRESTKYSSSTAGAPAFERDLLRNAAILCDIKCTLVEFAQHNPDEPDPRFDTEMAPACTESRVCVIRKRENREHKGKKVVTSIWTISEDGKVRCQQKLPEYGDTVPYCSYFQPEKVSLPPNEGDMTLRFHGETLGDIEKEIKTNWVNFIFETDEQANQFQSAIFGRTLLGSFRTTKTTVLHEGLRGAFAFEEQFANIEVLRMWEDDGLSMAGANGGVLALMHFGSNFGSGYVSARSIMSSIANCSTCRWAKWWMNSSKQQVRVKDENNKFARIKGIDIKTVRPGSGVSAADRIRSTSVAGESLQRRQSEMGVPNKKSPERRVTGIRVEFSNEEERARFVALSKRVQERMLPLPDV